jgi:hypothetical protein
MKNPPLKSNMFKNQVQYEDKRVGVSDGEGEGRREGERESVYVCL